MVSMMLAMAVSVLGADAGADARLDASHMKGYVLTQGDPRLIKFAPVFVVEAYDKPYNRVGTPSARQDKDGEEDVYVDTEKPTYYTEVREWQSEKGKYTNLIYRVHFEMSKANSKSINSGKGYNVGMIVVVTLDEKGKPLLINAVHTCGCFHAIIPTSFLPASGYPDAWKTDGFTNYREHLPGLVTYPEDLDANRPVIFLRDGSHRVADVQVAGVASLKEKYGLIDAVAAEMNALYHIPMGKGETSFFYMDGKNKGLVKGAYKKKEAILAPLIGDTHVGQDRAYGDKDEVPRGFYTTLNPTEKDNSDMWDYAKFVKANGWKMLWRDWEGGAAKGAGVYGVADSRRW